MARAARGVGRPARHACRTAGCWHERAVRRAHLKYPDISEPFDLDWLQGNDLSGANCRVGGSVPATCLRSACLRNKSICYHSYCKIERTAPFLLPSSKACSVTAPTSHTCRPHRSRAPRTSSGVRMQSPGARHVARQCVGKSNRGITFTMDGVNFAPRSWWCLPAAAFQRQPARAKHELLWAVMRPSRRNRPRDCTTGP